MNDTGNRPETTPENADETIKRYIANPLLPRLLMRLWNTDRPFDLVSDIAAPLRVHASEARAGLRELIRDGFVVQRSELDRTSYFLTKDSSARAAAAQVLRGTIEQRSA